MPQIVFTSHLRQHLDCDSQQVEGATLKQALAAVFADNPRLQGYICDDQGRLRKHVAVFVDGEMIRDPDGLTDPLSESAEIYVMQALSGG